MSVSTIQENMSVSTIQEKVFPKKPEPTINHVIQLGKLLSLPTMEQRTPEWFEMRNNMITASSAAAALGEGHFGNKKDFILKKCGHNKFKGNKYTEWGVKYEEVATKLYQLRSDTKVHEFGVLHHPSYSFLGASPDGINEKGIMLEIKCPYSRKITGIVPHHYWIQIQLQLEVCNLDLCDFLECKIVEYKNIKEYNEDTDTSNENQYKTKDNKEKGAVLTYITPDGENKYYHSELCLSEKEILVWEKEIEDKVPRCWTKKTITYWKFDFISCVRVLRDTKWFSEKLPIFRKTWEEVLHYRKVGCNDLFPKKKKFCKDLQEEWKKIENEENKVDLDLDNKNHNKKDLDNKNHNKKDLDKKDLDNKNHNKKDLHKKDTLVQLKTMNNVSEYEAIFDIELASWILPKYIPIYPVVLDKQSLEQMIVRIVGTNKIVSRCKTSLVRLLKIDTIILQNFHNNIRNIVYQVHNWISGLITFCKDLQDILQEESDVGFTKDIQECISNIIIIVEKWNTKLYPKWNEKWVSV